MSASGASPVPSPAPVPAGYLLRSMTEADIPEVAELEWRLFPIDAWPVAMFYDELAQPTRAYFVMVENETSPDSTGDSPGSTGDSPGAGRNARPERIVGYAGLMCIPPVADVQTIAVLPHLEGRGLGTALFTALLTQAARRGATEVLLEVRADNPRAQRLYRRYGFEQIHQRKAYYQDGVDALLMRSDLGRNGNAGRHDKASRYERPDREPGTSNEEQQ